MFIVVISFIRHYHVALLHRQRFFSTPNIILKINPLHCYCLGKRLQKGNRNLIFYDLISILHAMLLSWLSSLGKVGFSLSRRDHLRTGGRAPLPPLSWHYWLTTHELEDPEGVSQRVGVQIRSWGPLLLPLDDEAFLLSLHYLCVRFL